MLIVSQDIAEVMVKLKKKLLIDINNFLANPFSKL